MTERDDTVPLGDVMTAGRPGGNDGAADGPRPLDSSEEQLVRALPPALRELQRRMDDDLGRDHRLTQTEYLVLMHLSESVDHQMTMSSSASACHQSVSAISRTIGRLERDGLVRREQCFSDGRSFRAILTPEGLSRLQAAWPAHLRSVREHFLDHLQGVDIDDLATAFRAIARDGSQN